MDPEQDKFEEDPAAAFLQREHEELGDIGDEILGEPSSQSEVSGLRYNRPFLMDRLTGGLFFLSNMCRMLDWRTGERNCNS